MTVTNGEITHAERINGARDFWRITVDPESGEDVTVHLPTTTDCSATGAVCTKGDNPQPLSNSITHTFLGTQLSAGFEGFDHHHDGSTPMQFRLVFSEEVDTTAAEIKDHALTVTGATIIAVVQKDEGSTRKWTVTVRPAGTGPFDVVLAAGHGLCPGRAHLHLGRGATGPGRLEEKLRPTGHLRGRCGRDRRRRGAAGLRRNPGPVLVRPDTDGQATTHRTERRPPARTTPPAAAASPWGGPARAASSGRGPWQAPSQCP